LLRELIKVRKDHNELLRAHTELMATSREQLAARAAAPTSDGPQSAEVAGLGRLLTLGANATVVSAYRLWTTGDRDSGPYSQMSTTSYHNLTAGCKHEHSKAFLVYALLESDHGGLDPIKYVGDPSQDTRDRMVVEACGRCAGSLGTHAYRAGMKLSAYYERVHQMEAVKSLADKRRKVNRLG
jgi:hypothetical protein